MTLGDALSHVLTWDDPQRTLAILEYAIRSKWACLVNGGSGLMFLTAAALDRISREEFLEQFPEWKRSYVLAYRDALTRLVSETDLN